MLEQLEQACQLDSCNLMLGGCGHQVSRVGECSNTHWQCGVELPRTSNTTQHATKAHFMIIHLVQHTAEQYSRTTAVLQYDEVYCPPAMV
jgi:hypothetical protein